MKTSRRHLQYGSVGCDVIRLTLLMFRLMSCVNKQKSIKSAVRSESETASGVMTCCSPRRLLCPSAGRPARACWWASRGCCGCRACCRAASRSRPVRALPGNHPSCHRTQAELTPRLITNTWSRMLLEWLRDSPFDLRLRLVIDPRQYLSGEDGGHVQLLDVVGGGDH